MIEPATEFIDNWHIGAMAEHLTAITDGEIRNLMILVPPGCMKSLTVDVFWPCWEWTWQPWLKYLFGSYNKDLAVRDSKKCRDLVKSEQYRAEHGFAFELKEDTDRQDLFENDQSGFRMSAGVGGGHGRRVDRAVGDDTLTPDNADMPSAQQDVGRWWFELIPNRAQDPKTMAKVIVQQRLSTKDLPGQVEARGLDYEILKLPMRYEAKYAAKLTKVQLNNPDAIRDPRTKEGELLFPDRMPEDVVRDIEKNNGVFGTAAQLQQRPIPRGGDFKLFSRPRFESNIRGAAANDIVSYVRYWDKAFTSGGGAFTVGVLMGKTKNDDFWVLDVKRGQWGNEVDEEQHREYHEALNRGESPEKPMGFRDRQIVDCAKADQERYGYVMTWLEHEPGSQGADSCKVLIKLLQGYPVNDDPVKKDKVVRATTYASQQQAGNVYLLGRTWNEEFIAEHEGFPHGEFKDMVDASSGAFNKLTGEKDWGTYNPFGEEATT